ncbi:chorismate-binding protein [Pseudomonas corrugata]|jgi:para-aminobenzoate synthetase component I|uniref:chorismate-binding protein n=1 Tax=Pseudomonas corrugata TaxID=47879 RepID=UPI0018E6128E|nr:chorismate-binding protein [Pseudomonas corrugata]MBI6621977.1 chorismate-binding protein [Pseudomonas corrugata]MBI6692410.1 chorismate-binding protein [Pseudomonas corrugata]
MLIESCITDAFIFYKKLRLIEHRTGLLESLGSCVEGHSSFTLIGACARSVLTVTEGKASLLDVASGREEIIHDWKAVVDAWSPLDGPVLGQPYQTGCMGYIGYDRKNDFERYVPHIAQDTTMPDVCLVRYGAVLVFDRVAMTATWVVDDEALVERVAVFEALVRSEVTQEGAAFVLCGDVVCDTPEDQYQQSIERIIEYIKAGDVFQVNFTSRFCGSYLGDVIHLYEALRSRTPNPYFALLDFAQPLISTSPERFLSIEAGRITASPIKGTLRCEINGQDQRAALLGSAKNRAENVMIADLMRNDLGRICEQGTVQVEALCAIRRFNQLYHLESTIAGTLRDDVMLSDVLAATFPCGSITGAPKIRAVQIIEELESHRRGPYCGAIGFFGRQGWVQTCVGIRIIYFDNGQLYFHAGGGIVVDSDAAEEYAEMSLKAESIKSTIESFNVMNDVRARIDEIDDQLFEVVHRRFEVIKEACRIKVQYGVPVVQQSRMEQMIAFRKLRMQDDKEIPETCITDLYAVLTEHSMQLEHRAKP